MKNVLKLTMLLLLITSLCAASSLKEVKERGVLRHLGVYYANFNTGAGDGYDSEMMQMFAKYLGVTYQHVPTTFDTVIPDLTGIRVKPRGEEIDILGSTAPKGDVIANGFTVLDWRKKVLDYSDLTFPTQVWLIARSNSPINPIVPSNDPEKDIAAVKAIIKDKSVLEMKKTCLEASLYKLAEAGALIKSFENGTLGDMAPAIIKGEAETTLLDVPDALVAMEKWGSDIKVIGPISVFQGMAPAFTKDGADLREEFNKFLAEIKKNGALYKLVNKYYPLAFQFYPDFFSDLKQ